MAPERVVLRLIALDSVSAPGVPASQAFVDRVFSVGGMLIAGSTGRTNHRKCVHDYIKP